MDSTLLQYSFQVCPLFLNHISYSLLYAYHLTEQWTQHSSSTHSRSVHYFLIIFPTLYYTRIISQSNGLNTPLVLILGLSTISQSYFLLFTIRVSSHRAMDSTLLQYSFQVCPLILNHISHFYYTRIISHSNGLNTPLILILGLSTNSQSYFPLITIRVSSHRAMDSTLLQYSFQVCPLFLNHISHFYYTRIISQSNGLNTPLVLILGLSTISQSYFPPITIAVSSHRAMDSALLQYSFQVNPLFLNHISHFYYTRIISQSNGLNTPLVLILGLSTISQSYFLLFTIRVSSHRAMDSTLLQYSFQVCPLFLNHISHFYYTRIISHNNGLNTALVLILGLSTNSQSYFPLITIRVSSHRAMDSTLLQYSFQVCPLFLNHISHFYYTRIISQSNGLNTPLVLILGLSTISQSYFPFLLYAYHLTEQWTQHSSSTHSRSVHYFSIIFPTFIIRVPSHRAMDSTLLQYSFQVCPLILNHISHFYYTRIISQSNGLNTPLVLILGLSTISQSYFLLFTIRVSSHRAMDSTLLQYSFQVCPLFLNHFSHFYYTRIISHNNGLNTPLVLILGLSTNSQSYFPLITIRVSSHRAMDSTLLQYSFQVCPLFLNHISHFYYTRIISQSNGLNTPLVLILGLSTISQSYFPLLLYPYHLTEQWTQHSSSPHSRSVHYFSIIFPTFTIRVSSHRAMDSTLLQYSFQVCPLILNHISHLLLYPYHLTEQWTQHSSSTHSRSVHYFSIIFPIFTIPVSSHRAMDSTLLQSSFQVCPLFLNNISHFYYTRIISQSNGLNTPLLLILGLSTISQTYFPLITIPVSSHRAMDSTLLQSSFQVFPLFLNHISHFYYTRIISKSNGLNTPLVLILGLSTISQSFFPLITIPVSSHRAMDSTLLQSSFQVCPLFLNHISHFYYTRIISQSNGLNTPLVLILGLSTISQSYFPLITIPVSSHRAMDSTLLQYSFQVYPLFLNHISHLLLYPYHLTEQGTQHSSSTHSRSVHYFSIIFPTFTIPVSSHRAMDSTLLQSSFQVCPLFLNHISHFYYTRIISQSNGLNTPLVLILGLSTISQTYFPLLLYAYHLTD